MLVDLSLAVVYAFYLKGTSFLVMAVWNRYERGRHSDHWYGVREGTMWRSGLVKVPVYFLPAVFAAFSVGFMFPIAVDVWGDAAVAWGFGIVHALVGYIAGFAGRIYFRVRLIGRIDDQMF